MAIIQYHAQPTPSQFHLDDSFVRAIIGPIGSGKSVACCWEIMLKAMNQTPSPLDNTRYTRWVVVRNTYRELIDTTLQTWFDWFPEKAPGTEFKKMDMKYILHQGLRDGTILHLEVLFRALDKPDDIKKLLSLEITGGWLNECREIPKAVFDMLIGRLGRYPSKRIGGPTWHGAILDTNPPDEDHWFYKLFEEVNPSNHKLFHQPSGMAYNAENVDNLPSSYYTNMIQGKDQEWVNVYVHGLYGFVRDGKPIYPEYQDDVHTTQETILLPNSNDSKSPIYIGLDFGLTPAAVFGYRTPTGQWKIFDELVSDDMGALRFGKILGKKIRDEYRTHELEIWGDPAGEHRAETDERTAFEVLRSLGINAWPAIASSRNQNDFTLRREAVASALLRLSLDGKPGLIIGPKARNLRKAMAGGYKFKRLKVTGDDRFHDKPDKNQYSHIAEALQYLFIGAGEDYALVGFNPSSEPLQYDDRGVI